MNVTKIKDVKRYFNGKAILLLNTKKELFSHELRVADMVYMNSRQGRLR